MTHNQKNVHKIIAYKQQPYCSSEEFHVGSSNSVVGVSHCTQQHLSQASASSVTREQVVEDGCVDGSDGSFTEVIIVGFDVW